MKEILVNKKTIINNALSKKLKNYYIYYDKCKNINQKDDDIGNLEK